MYDRCSAKSVARKEGSAKSDSDKSSGGKKEAGDEDIEACDPEATGGTLLKSLADLSKTLSLMPSKK